MKQKIFLLILSIIIAFTPSVFAQKNRLYLVNYKTGKQKRFREGKKFEFKLKEWQKFDYGTLKEVSSKKILVDQLVVNIGDIEAVRKRNFGNVVCRVIGSPMVFVGMLVFLKGGFEGVTTKFEDKKVYVDMAAGVGIVTVGNLLYRIKNKKYVLGVDYGLIVKTRRKKSDTYNK